MANLSVHYPRQSDPQGEETCCKMLSFTLDFYSNSTLNMTFSYGQLLFPMQEQEVHF
jgi:hypothetical protein